ncbi:hypothetical protein ARMA_1363 [Ardenticatena maritima]|uniref:Uncharacterized protein n=1 Tax=Ardenticatena maritima TaxID=872965 RepID=A0A0M9UCK5_9CHLR|nr:hypothetical protein ARMA_1363 [Ardenticatena maritima]
MAHRACACFLWFRSVWVCVSIRRSPIWQVGAFRLVQRLATIWHHVRAEEEQHG